METPSFNCICGKTYRYRSGLSKHQRGSQSEGILPCPSFASAVAESASDRALAERLIECFESIQMPDNHRVIDYSVSDVIPLNVTFEGDVRTRRRSPHARKMVGSGAPQQRHALVS